MSKQLIASMPDDVDIAGAWVIEWDAVDPTTGASVSGVTISSANVVGTETSSGPTGTVGLLGPFMLVPGPDA